MRRKKKNYVAPHMVAYPVDESALLAGSKRNVSGKDESGETIITPGGDGGPGTGSADAKPGIFTPLGSSLPWETEAETEYVNE